MCKLAEQELQCQVHERLVKKKRARESRNICEKILQLFNVETASILLGSVQEDKITTNFNTFFNKNSINIL